MLNPPSYNCVLGECFRGRPEGRGDIFPVGYKYTKYKTVKSFLLWLLSPNCLTRHSAVHFTHMPSRPGIQSYIPVCYRQNDVPPPGPVRSVQRLWGRPAATTEHRPHTAYDWPTVVDVSELTRAPSIAIHRLKLCPADSGVGRSFRAPG